MSIHIDPAKLEELLINAGVEIPLARAHREMVSTAIVQAVEGFVTEQDRKLMETRLELAISKQTAEVTKSLGDMQKQLGEQTWRIIGAVCVIAGLSLTIAKFL